MSAQTVVPAAARSVITSTSKTTFKVGTYAALTDTFTSVVDLNDRVTFWLDTVDLGQPQKVDARTFTLRSPGERIANWQYKNRHIKVSVHLLYQSGTAALITSLRNLLAVAEQPPYRLAFAPPNHTVLTYADVVAVTHTIPYDAKQIINGALGKIAIDFECLPGLPGDRITLQNLVMNPGFEAASGPAVSVFADTFLNTNAYTTVGGAGGPSVGTAGAAYGTVVTNDLPYHYYRMADTNTTCLDARGVSNGTYTGTAGTAYIQGAGGALCSDANASCYFNGAAGYVNGAATGLQTGNGGWTVEAWILPQAWPTSGTNSFVAGWGNGSAKSTPILFVNSSGQVFASGNAWGDTGGGSMTLNAWHHVVGTWDGTTMRCYLDGVQVGTPTTPGAMTTVATTFFIGAGLAGGSYFNGRVDEVAFYNGALSATQVLAHYTAAYANTLVIPTGGGVKFGSPTTGAINNWQVRFRYATSQTLYFALHYTDANNILRVAITNTTASIQHVIAGVANTLASTSVTLTPGNWYWLRATQFPNVTSITPFVQALLYNDSAGAIGAQVGATLGPVNTTNATTALSGYLEMESGNNERLVVGGVYSGTLLVQAFGPAGWTFSGNNGFSATGFASGAWEQNTANTYANGPATSFGCARIDLPPGGTISAYWESYSGGAPGGTPAIPTTTGQTMAASLYIRSSGLAATMSTQLLLREWNSAGALLRSTTLQSVTGTQAAWTKLSGTLAMGASTAFCSILVLVTDANAGTSAGGTLWIDNVQCWNQTTTGQTVMPYCELRFPLSPAQLLVSGIQGDIPVFALSAVGTYAGTTAGLIYNLALGLRATPQRGAQLLASALILSASNNNTPQLDSSAPGGHAAKSTAAAGAGNPLYVDTLFSPISTLAGTYHAQTRVTTNSTTWQNVQPLILEETLAQVPTIFNMAQSYGPTLNLPITNSTTPIIADAGAVVLPLSPILPTQDASAVYTDVELQFESMSTLSTLNYIVLLPVDGALLLQATSPNNQNNAANPWFWHYNALASSLAQVDPTVRASISPSALPTPSNAGAVVASAAGAPVTQPLADSVLTLDPTQIDATSGLAVAQGLGIFSDTNGLLYPLLVELQYTPLFLYAREA